MGPGSSVDGRVNIDLSHGDFGRIHRSRGHDARRAPEGSGAHDDPARPYPQLAVSHHRLGGGCGPGGGRRVFPSLTPAHFSGASVGGSFLKVGWIGIGLRMEILVDGRRIVTSPVRDISTGGAGSSRVH